MKTVFDHIEHIKGKPHHIRKKVVFTVAAAITGVIALVWLGVSISTNAFALKPTSFAESTGQGGIVATESSEPTGVSGAGTASAAAVTPVPVVSNPPAGGPHIEIVTATTTASKRVPSDATTIPF